MKVSVIISAHDKGRELGHALAGYAAQTRMPDEIIVAQDGTDPAIRQALGAAAPIAAKVQHLMQEHRGFGKYRALNRAILVAGGDLLLFTDADCIPRDDYVETFLRLARPGSFLSGGSHVSIPESYHRQHDLRPAILDQSLFAYRRLRAIPGFGKSRTRLTRSRPLARCLDLLTQRSAFSGANSCAWRRDVLEVGGFDESMGYGGGDINLGLRLNNIGVRGVRARHSLVSLHLDHAHSYYCPERERANHAWNREVRLCGHTLPRSSHIKQQIEALWTPVSLAFAAMR
jgi:glycosyltransferase involved in cell wall biosynthesis